MDIENSADQLIIRVGKACNFKCNFCNVSANENHVKLKENIEDIVRNFHYKIKYSNLKSKNITITISGGEPSIFQKETLFALKYILKFLDKKGIVPYFDIQTNASNISLDFAKRLKKFGISEALVSFHMIDEKIFEEVIQVNYKEYFYRIIEGINNLHKAGIKVFTNTILSNENKNNFFETIKFIEKEFEFIKVFHIGMIQPHGDAERNLVKIMPKYGDVIDIYNKSLFYIKNKNKEVISHFVGPPACYIGHLGNSLELSENILTRKHFTFSDKYLINKINDNNKIQVKECDKCLYNNICSGIWKEYVGLQKLKPYNYKLLFQNNIKNEKKSFWYVIEQLDENLQKIYDKNIRQIFIKTSLGNKEEIYKQIKKSTKIGFYKITLLIDDNFTLEEDIFLTGLSNIQIYIEKINLDYIKKLINFSNKFKPQFRIDLDIFIKQYSKENLKKIDKININNFVKIYNIKSNRAYLWKE